VDVGAVGVVPVVVVAVVVIYRADDVALTIVGVPEGG